MNKDTLQRHFFLGFFLVISIITLFVFWPFVKVLALSAILAVVLHPIYKKITLFLGNRPSLGALVVIILVAFVIAVPLTLVGVRIFDESQGLYFEVRGHESEYLSRITDIIENTVHYVNPDFALNLEGYISQVMNWVVGNIGNLLSGTAGAAMSVLLVIISLFFFLKDGEKFKESFVHLSPLSNTYDRQILTKIEKTIGSVVKGVLLVALIQGVLAGLGLTIFGVNNATLWGAIAAVCALVPGLGTALVILPAIIYLYFTGAVAQAIGLLVWGVMVVGLVDNFLTPYFYSKGVSIHPLLVLFSVLGGLIAFGPLGFIFGPIILTLFFSLLDIYRELFAEKKVSA